MYYSCYENTCDDAAQAARVQINAYLASNTNVDRRQLMHPRCGIRGLVTYTPWLGDSMFLKSVYAHKRTDNAHAGDTKFARMTYEFTDGSVFELIGDLDASCCESFGYMTFMLGQDMYSLMGISVNDPDSVYEVHDKSDIDTTQVYDLAPDISDPDSDALVVTRIYVCIVSDMGDLYLVIFTDNPAVPAICFYNHHGGPYPHSANWTFCDSNGEETVSASTNL